MIPQNKDSYLSCDRTNSFVPIHLAQYVSRKVKAGCVNDLLRVKVIGKAVPLQAWTGAEGSKKLRLPDYVTTAQGCGRLSALCADRLYLLTPWCRVFVEKLTGLQLVKKFPAFYGTRSFITALTSVRHLSLS